MNGSNIISDLHPHLLVHTVRGDKRVSLSDASSWTIGRGKENIVPLADKCASRNHAMLQLVSANTYYLIDLGSRNGSFVNGRRVTIPLNLKNGDSITVGETTIEFFCPETTALTNATTSTDVDEVTDTMTLHRRRLITIVVVDIRDFTKLTQQIDERLLSEVIGTWFRKAGVIINRYGSWVDKYIGDAVMSVWIHNTEKRSDLLSNQEIVKVYSAVRDLAKMSHDLNAEFSLPFPIKVGAGVNTGYATIGQMGSSDHPDYTALGDTVNAAFRLESATKEIGMDIALGVDAYEHTPQADTLLMFKRELVHLKGYDRPMLAYIGTFEDLGQFLSKIAQ